MVVYNPTIRKKFIEDYYNGEFKNSTEFKRFYKLYLEKLPVSAYDGLAAVDTFISDNPYDAYAWRYKGIQHYAVKQYEKAITSYQKAFEYDPILRNGFQSLYGVAKSKAKLQKFKEVEELAEQLATLYKTNDSKGSSFLRSSL